MMTAKKSIFRTPEGEAKYIAAYDAMLEHWPVPYESMQISTRAGSVHLIASGPEDAPSLILFHMASVSATMWFPNVASLSKDYRVYAVDTLNDVGKSVPIKPTRTRSASTEWISDVLDGLRIDAGYILGASYGGWLALNLAMQMPERVKKVALLAPAGGINRLGWKFFATMGPAALFPYRSFLQFTTRPMTASGFVWNTHLFDQLMAGLRYRSKRRMFNFAYPVVFPDAELRAIDVPVLLLLGDHEIICNPHRTIARARRLIPHIDAELISNVGHGLSQEKPDYVNARILEFFASASL